MNKIILQKLSKITNSNVIEVNLATMQDLQKLVTGVVEEFKSQEAARVIAKKSLEDFNMKVSNLKALSQKAALEMYDFQKQVSALGIELPAQISNYLKIVNDYNKTAQTQGNTISKIQGMI